MREGPGEGEVGEGKRRGGRSRRLREGLGSCEVQGVRILDELAMHYGGKSGQAKRLGTGLVAVHIRYGPKYVSSGHIPTYLGNGKQIRSTVLLNTAKVVSPLLQTPLRPKHAQEHPFPYR